MLKSVSLEPFRPNKGIANPHLQTIAGRVARKREGIVFSRLRINTPDQDFIDVDFPEVPGFFPEATTPVVLLLHGLEGSARKGYGYETYRQLARHGIRSVGLNFRSCSGEINLTRHTYHAGMTEDIHLIVGKMKEWFPEAPLGAIGFSLGANMLLKYLGEQAENIKFQTAVAVSPPFILGRGNNNLNNGFRRMYLRVFMRSLKQKVIARAPLLEDFIDIDRVLAAQNFQEFDAAFTVPLYGFRDVWDYYEQCSSSRFLPDIRIPTLLLRSMDDPIFDPDDVPHDAIAANPSLRACLTEFGGHVGFVEGQPGNWRCWSERQAARFLAAHLTN